MPVTEAEMARIREEQAAAAAARQKMIDAQQRGEQAQTEQRGEPQTEQKPKRKRK